MSFDKGWVSKVLVIACILIFALIFFLSHYNDGTWYINIATYTVPVLFGIGFLLILILLILKKILYSIGLFLLGFLLLFKPVKETFSIGFLGAEKPRADECPLNVMTYNVSTFNNHRSDTSMADDSIFKSQFFRYLHEAPDELDIICLQEFHHDDNDNQRIVDEIVRYTGANYFYTVPIWQPWIDGFLGIITLSKYPIINRGTLFVGANELNRGIFTDIAYQNDTIRVINIHLHSMNIRIERDTTPGISGRVRNVMNALKEGSEIGKFQIEQVTKAIDSSPFPVLLCGDFNTFPYGYAYQQVKKSLENSFERSGKGFGFTLNIFPYFVRLDNQFSSEELVPVETKVIRTIRHSDHFPVVSKYLIRK